MVYKIGKKLIYSLSIPLVAEETSPAQSIAWLSLKGSIEDGDEGGGGRGLNFWPLSDVTRGESLNEEEETIMKKHKHAYTFKKVNEVQRSINKGGF